MATRRKRGRPWERLRAQVLMEETHCRFCGKPVDKRLHHNHPQSAVVDHVLPLAHGGPELDRSNVRLAHRWCNGSAHTNGQARTPRRTTTREWW